MSILGEGTQQQLVDRLIHFAFKLRDGQLEEVGDWLESLGCAVDRSMQGQLTVTGLTGIRVGLLPSDPNTCAVQIGSAVAGQFWPLVYPGLQKAVNKRRRDEQRKRRN